MPTLLQKIITLVIAATAQLTLSGDHTGSWTWPLDARPPQVVRGFEPPQHAWGEGHRGVDLAGAEGDIVRAAGAGTVTYAGLIAGVPIVAVSHGPVRTTYQPVAATVSVGQRVGLGEGLGTLSAVGSHCPPATCLHWGLLRGDSYLDPLSLIGTGGGPRLLPLGSGAVPGDSPLATAPDHVHLSPAGAGTASAAAGLGAAAGAGAAPAGTG
jgi:murein DD-endopeptidase MepM/ murein hydrolase activator NlpD